MTNAIDWKEINKAIAANPDVQRACRDFAEASLEESKGQLIHEFIAHPISVEIAGGSSVSNSSGTLGGYGNLFSFIGFDAGDNPITRWATFIQDRIKIKKNSRTQANVGRNGSFDIFFEIDSPTESDFVSKAQMPWESGRSWLTSIERGISGFSYYIARRLGRSGGGVQSRNPLRSATYSRTNYWSGLWKNFTRRLEGK